MNPQQKPDYSQAMNTGMKKGKVARRKPAYQNPPFSWLILIGVYVIISIAITLILNYLHPGTRFSFFAW
jgi:hypothetical protein